VSKPFGEASDRDASKEAGEINFSCASNIQSETTKGGANNKIRATSAMNVSNIISEVKIYGASKEQCETKLRSVSNKLGGINA